jgi:predicted acylesterase/phospholipase RssA
MPAIRPVLSILAALALALALAACAEANRPLNPVLAEGGNPEVLAAAPAEPGEAWVALALSGGGHRASAFAFGVMQELGAAGGGDDPDGLLSELRFVTGVSGGAVLAAWFGLEGPEGLAAFRERYLLGNGERYMTFNPFDAEVEGRGVFNGINARHTFGRFLDEALFGGRTFADLAGQARATVAINASDVAAAVPFVFNPTTFDALCADLARLPLSEAVAASAAFPVVFAPITLAAPERGCDYREPAWLRAARLDPGAHPALRVYAEAMARYADPEAVREVRLLDGGMTDSFGITGLLAERARAGTPWAPMTPEEAVRARRVLVLTVDATWVQDAPALAWLEPVGQLAGVAVLGLWQRLVNPGSDLDLTEAHRRVAATTRDSMATLENAAETWRRALVRWRCGLDRAEVVALRGSAEGWDCRDLRFFIGQVSSAALTEAELADFRSARTRLRLEPGVADRVIAAGRAALRRNPAYRAFRRAG